jgi:hypothetical protein
MVAQLFWLAVLHLLQIDAPPDDVYTVLRDPSELDKHHQQHRITVGVVLRSTISSAQCGSRLVALSQQLAACRANCYMSAICRMDVLSL